MAGEPLIRRAGAGDVPVLMSLCAEHAAFERLAFSAGERLDALAAALAGSPPRLYAWLAHCDGVAVAYASATVDFSTLERAPFLHMDCLYVRPAWRNRQLGQRLWQELRACATQLGCNALQWQTPAWNRRAARFYRRLGAAESRKRRYRFALAEG